VNESLPALEAEPGRIPLGDHNLKCGGEIQMASNLQVTTVLSGTAQFVQDQNGNTSPLALSTEAVTVGGNGRRGQVAIFDENANFTLNLGGIEGAARIGLGGNGSIGAIDVFDAATRQTISIGGPQGPGRIRLGGSGSRGQIAIFDENSDFTINLGGTEGAGRIGLGGNGSQGVIDVFDADTQHTIRIDGQTGDVQLLGADCAEDFDVEGGEALEAGTVMVIGEEDTLHRCVEAYDKKVAGVLSGAGGCKPGIVLGKQPSQDKRLPLALTGKVYCKVDAQYAPIGVGDLLTTSPTSGHAMKAEDPLKAFGAVIGKALRPLTEGQGLIPVLIALQ
jgi:hypothetical protein